MHHKILPLTFGINKSNNVLNIKVCSPLKLCSRFDMKLPRNLPLLIPFTDGILSAKADQNNSAIALLPLFRCKYSIELHLARRYHVLKPTNPINVTF